MANIIAFGASNSSKSINRDFAAWAAGRIDGANVTVLDLNDYEMPIYSVDREKEIETPEASVEFKNHIRNADGIVISFAEYNGSYTAGFKNIFDWISRFDGPIWENKPMLLLAAAPGARGAKAVLDNAVWKFPFQGGKVAGSFSLPHFKDNFNNNDGITNQELLIQFDEQLRAFEAALNDELVAV